MVNDMADVNDCVEYYSINFITKNTGQFLREGSLYFPVSNMVAKVATDAIQQGKIVTFPKGLKTEVTVSDLSIQEVDGLKLKQNLAIIKKRNDLSVATSTLNGFDFFNFFVCNNILASNGYFITNYNREEKYIEIINTGNQELIMALEEYLTSIDRMGIPNYQYKRFKKFEEDVWMCESEEEVEGLLNNYL